MSYIGIDISKAWFDAFCLIRKTGKRFSNDEKGWLNLQKWGSADALLVMEASGPYYLFGACWAHEHGFEVSVLNPLIIRRYSQMRLSRAKTDAKDAQLIAEYARDHSPQIWTPPSKVNQAMQQLMSLRDGLLRQQTMLLGQQEAFTHAVVNEAIVHQVLEDQKKGIKQSLAQINQRLEHFALEHYRECYLAVQSIPGVGPKTALLLLCMTDGFSRFEDARSLASYVGICPRVYSSGSSVRGRGAICKLGSSKLRKLLYMCSWTAKTCNPACAELYKRMSQKGKPERVIKVAIAHKLLRQAFAVGKRCEPFDLKKARAA
jgi:transposase